MRTREKTISSTKKTKSASSKSQLQTLVAERKASAKKAYHADDKILTQEMKDDKAARKAAYLVRKELGIAAQRAHARATGHWKL